ncbi:MAG TPA: hemerythrin domain-containing protein [Kofleriaceae bacterium]|nr:hemerythrin domain-containing protein [Kofleriaceae bacterium]
MMHSHDYLRDLFERLLAAMAADAMREIGALWTELDHGLVAHMIAEERHVLPAFAKVDRAEALALLREHGKIRELLLELGVAIDLHCLRYERANELVALLLDHAGREDQLLYRWADQALPAEAIEAVKREVAAG